MQQDEPSDYVIATGITTTIRDFIRMAFEEIGVGIRFKGEGIDEVAIIESIDEGLFVKKVGDAYLENFKKRVGEEVVGVDPQYFRPTEVELLIGDATKARTRLGWEPEYSLAALIEDMMKNEDVYKRQVYARMLSSMQEERKKASSLYPKSGVLGQTLISEKEIKQALYAAKLVSYAQGFSLLCQASKRYDWQLDYGCLLYTSRCV